MTKTDPPAEAARAVAEDDAGRPPRPKPPVTTRVRRVLLELVVLAGLFWAATTWQERTLLPTDAKAPGFRLESLDGHPVSLESLRGKRLLLHFWATWCGVCQREQSALNAVQATLGDNQVLLSVVADSDDPDVVRRFVTEKGIRYPVLLASDGVLRAYGIGAFPTNYFIDRDGNVGSHTVGMSTRFGLRARLAFTD